MANRLLCFWSLDSSYLPAEWEVPFFVPKMWALPGGTQTVEGQGVRSFELYEVKRAPAQSWGKIPGIGTSVRLQTWLQSFVLALSTQLLRELIGLNRTSQGSMQGAPPQCMCSLQRCLLHKTWWFEQGLGWDSLLPPWAAAPGRG